MLFAVLCCVVVFSLGGFMQWFLRVVCYAVLFTCARVLGGTCDRGRQLLLQVIIFIKLSCPRSSFGSSLGSVLALVLGLALVLSYCCLSGVLGL